jgi:hypothetical protein
MPQVLIKVNQFTHENAEYSASHATTGPCGTDAFVDYSTESPCEDQLLLPLPSGLVIQHNFYKNDFCFTTEIQLGSSSKPWAQALISMMLLRSCTSVTRPISCTWKPSTT